MLLPERSLAAALVLAAVPGLAAAATLPSLCAAGEQVAFSCPIAGSRKTVSLCLQPGGSGPPAARYVFGTASHPELVYPAGAPTSATFRASHLAYAGATGGDAYSFVNSGMKYILYEIDGTGFTNAGVLVQPLGHLHASTELICRAVSRETANRGGVYQDPNLLDRTSTWGPDPDLEDHGLPSKR